MFRDAVRQFFIYGAGSIAQSAFSFILLPLYMRFFEPSEYGVISLLLVSVNLLTLFANVGIVSGLYMLYYEAETGERKKLAGTTWLWYFLGAGAGAVILVIGATTLSKLLFHTAEHVYAIRLVGVFFFFSLLVEVPITLLRMEQKAVHYVAFSLLKFASDFGLKITFISFWGRGIEGYFESGVITNAVLLGSILPFTLRYVSFVINKSYLKRLLQLGFPFVFSTLAMWALTTSDRYILNYFQGQAPVGIYAVANTFANLFYVFFLTPFGLFWNPFFLSFAAQRPVADTKMLLEKTTRYTFILGGALYLAISLGSRDALLIVTDLFGAKEGYIEAATVVPLVTLGGFFYLLHGRFGNALFVVKRPAFLAVGSSISAAFSFGVNFLLIPRFGVLGAAMSTALAYFLYMVLTYIWTQRLFPIKYSIWGLVKGFLFGVICFIISLKISIEQPWISLFVKIFTGGGLFLILNWFLSGLLTRDERHRLLTYFSAIKNRIRKQV